MLQKDGFTNCILVVDVLDSVFQYFKTASWIIWQCRDGGNVLKTLRWCGIHMPYILISILELAERLMFESFSWPLYRFWFWFTALGIGTYMKENELVLKEHFAPCNDGIIEKIV